MGIASTDYPGGAAMSWQCRLIDLAPDEIPWDRDRVVGDMWYGKVPDPTTMLDPQSWGHLSPDYLAHRVGRPVLWVELPRSGAMCLDWMYQSSNGWTRTGDPPNVSVTPSINCKGDYHGFLTNGVVSDDVEGRTYP
jgi:hypothetical protein